ncbi:hypothetical protein TNIN_349231 [Trichonephila inaurata madagascariensis]|uniref:Uncharacterized protein n=1 Tax=Trichonephila inaurata madagascariensis TaxID=2747483 RepID=A0A8X6Y1L3_9ARAC|nr:hypothetical protein TNIN_349231 [Trichonephila inaurata madagascariensis]
MKFEVIFYAPRRIAATGIGKKCEKMTTEGKKKNGRGQHHLLLQSRHRTKSRPRERRNREGLISKGESSTTGSRKNQERSQVI